MNFFNLYFFSNIARYLCYY